jgi:RNase P protein component
VRRSGLRIRVEYLDVRAMPSALPYARVGFVVPKYGHTSVDRNRLKRRLRELVRTRLLPSLRPSADAGGRARADTTARDGAHGGTHGDRHPDVVAGADAGASVDGSVGRSTIPPIDVVVRALPMAYDAPFDALAREIGRVYEGVRGRMTPAGS